MKFKVIEDKIWHDCTVEYSKRGKSVIKLKINNISERAELGKLLLNNGYKVYFDEKKIGLGIERYILFEMGSGEII